MVEGEGYASYMFLVRLTTKEHELVNNFGYRIEERFQEQIIRKIMQAVAEQSDIIALEVTPLAFQSADDAADARAEAEVEYEEDDD